MKPREGKPTCRMLCGRIREVGETLSGQKLYRCPRTGLTVGEDARPLPRCLRKRNISPENR